MVARKSFRLAVRPYWRSLLSLLKIEITNLGVSARLSGQSELKAFQTEARGTYTISRH